MAKKIKNEYITMKTLNEGIDAILKGVDNITREQTQLFNKKLESELAPMKADIIFMKRDIQDIKNKYVDENQFSKLKTKVDNHLASHN